MPRKKETGEAAVEESFDPLDLLTKEPKTVVLTLKSSEGVVVARACEALQKFAEKSAKNQIELTKLDAIEPLLDLLRSKDEALRAHAAVCVATMATNRDVRNLLRKLGAIPLLIELLANTDNVISQERASCGLASLVEEYSGKAIAVEHGAIPALLALLASPDCDTQKNAIRALLLITDDYKGRPELRTHNDGLSSVLNLLDSEYPVVQKLALDTLIRCSSEVESRNALRELGASSRLVEILQNKEFHDLHLPVLHILSYCLSDPETAITIQGSGHLQMLVDFARQSTLPESQQHAVAALSRAAENESVRKNLHETNIEELLISLLTSNHVGVAKAALEASAVMAKSAVAKHTLAEQGAINCLMQLLVREEMEIKELALMTLATLSQPDSASSSFISKLIVENGGMQPIVAFLTEKSSTPSIFANVAACLANVAEEEYLRSFMLDEDVVVSGLVALLRSNDDAVQKQAASALASLFTDARARHQFQLHSGLGPLLALLYSKNSDVRKSASRALSGCASDSVLANQICSQSGLERLQELIENRKWSWEAKCFEIALKCALDNCLPAKYWLEGYLAPTDIIQDGFYDMGQAFPGKKFLPLEDAYKLEMSHQVRTILLVNGKEDQHNHHHHHHQGNESGSRPASEMELKPPQDPKERASTKLAKGKKKKEKETTFVNTVAATKETSVGDHGNQGDANHQNEFQPPADPVFKSYIDDVRNTILPLVDEGSQIRLLAEFVFEKMGGAIPRGSFKSEMLVAGSDVLVKKELQCNVVPIGRVTMGTSRHRALLFKALADRLAVPCSVVRGKYGRTYNEVFLSNIGKDGEALKRRAYIVDLLYEPGKLMLDHTRQAEEYKN